MSYDLKREEEVKEYVENLGIEYRFGCYKEKKPEVCHLLADYLEAIKKDYKKASKVYKSNCDDYNYPKSCLKYGNYLLTGRGRDNIDQNEALKYFEKGCELNEPVSCLHAGVLLTATGPATTVPRDIPKGGSGLDDPNLFESPVERDLTTPYGKPSDVLLEGFIKGVPCVLLARHGRKHQHQPSDINYRANIWALKQAGCTHILASTATGSLIDKYRPGDLVVLDDFIDRTWGRSCTFFDRTAGGPRGVCHLPMRPAFCERARQALLAAARDHGHVCHETGTAVTIQGPRFSSRAESLMHRMWGGHVVNMTTVPEVVLAKEAGLSYAAVALVTDYDCWRENEQSVSVSEVLAMFARNIQKAIDVIVGAVQILAKDDDYSYLQVHKELVESAVMLKE